FEGAGGADPSGPRCGDGMVDTQEGEDCDDANHDNSDDCLDTCRLPTCGDGFVQGDELCDDASGAWIHLGFHTAPCGVRDGGRLECFGGENESFSSLLSGAFRQVGEHQHMLCGLRVSGELACARTAEDIEAGWGAELAEAPRGTFESLVTSAYQSCALDAEGVATCWGFDVEQWGAEPSGRFQKIDLGYYIGCGLRFDGTVHCWGDDADGAATPLAGGFLDVAVGGAEDMQFGCGIRTNNSLDCWGSSEHSALPLGQFGAVTAGDGYACAVDLSGHPHCWASTGYDVGEVPDEAFAHVEAGRRGACGLRSDGSVRCWGSYSDPPNENCLGDCGVGSSGTGGAGTGGAGTGGAGTGGAGTGGAGTGGAGTGGASGSTGRACDQRSVNQSCMVYTGAGYSDATIGTACASGVRTDSCTTSNAYGRCTLNGGTNLEATGYYYTGNGYPADGSPCTQAGGTWQAL
ncbi:MAG TPA: hypothetical protein VLC09_09900, partial [Polyangiaceae bacterium]|nr:hypothetical protein [Polyangiaceae bacterium]